MKSKIGVPFILCLILFVFSLFGVITTLAAPNTFVVSGVQIIDKSEGVVGDIESFENEKIINNVVFYKVGDYVVYDVTIKNNSDEEYTITSITDNNTNENISYTYDDYKNTRINKKGELNFRVKATYNKKIENLSKRDQNYSVKFLINYLDKNNNENTSEVDILNPKTGDNIIYKLVLLIISCMGLIALILKKNVSKNAKHALKALLAVAILIPLSASALTVLFNFSFVNSYKLHDKLLVTVIVDDEEQKQYIDYNTKLDSLEPPVLDGFIFNSWKLEDGSLFDINEPIVDDIVIVADLTIINYDISYSLNGGAADNKTAYTVKDEFTLNNPTKTGYTFDGWTGTGITEMTKTVKVTKGSIGDRSYEAHFTPNSYVIKYDANGGTGTMEDQNMVYDTPSVLRTNGFEKTSFEFGGWNTKADGTGDDYYDEEEVNNLKASGQVILYAQWVKAATLDTGSVLNVKMKNLANDADDYTPDYDEFTIEHIKRGKKLPSGYTPTEETTISSASSETPVYIWWDDDTKTIYWYSKAQTLFLNSDAGHMFEEMECLQDVSILYEVDSSHITTLEKMFAFTWEASYDGIETLDTSHVTNMQATFRGTNFSDVDLISNWNTGEVTTMEETFSGCRFTSTSALASWNTSKVKNMKSTFEYCYDLTDLTGLASWNTLEVTDMSNMFSGDRSITDLSALAYFAPVKVTDMSHMFQYCYGITDLTPLTVWGSQLKKVKTMNGMFGGASITSLNGLGTWKMDVLENMSGMFQNCSHLTDITDLVYWGSSGMGFTTSLKSISSLFSGCSSLVNISVLSDWQGKVYNVETTSSMFSGCTNLESITPLYHWSLSSVDDVSNMFYNCKKATGQLLIRKPITNYSKMFSGAVTAEGAHVRIDYPVYPGADYTSEQVRDFIWERIIGKPYQYNSNISLGMAVYS